MSAIGTFTVAGQADLKRRLSADGLAALGLAGPLLSPVWTQEAAPAIDLARLRFTPSSVWYAPIAGMLLPVADGARSGMSGLDGAPAVGDGDCAMLSIHPQARLRLERALVAQLQAGGVADQSLRPVPSTILIHNIAAPVTLAQLIRPGELALPAGEVSFHDERGLIIDPFAFAAALDKLTLLIGATPTGPALGTLNAIASLAPAGQFAQLVDLHGRPWVDPPGGAGNGVGFFTGPANARIAAGRIAAGTLTQWPAGAVLAAEADPGDLQRPRSAATCRIGWATVGVLDTAPLAWPAAGAGTPVRDTLRIAVADLAFHLLGNRSASPRDDVGPADANSIAETPPQVRDGSPVTLLADGRSTLGFFGRTILQMQGGDPAGAFASGPIFAVSVAFDDAQWPLATIPGPAGRWPLAPAALPVVGSDATILAQLQAMRSSANAAWASGSNDALVTLSGRPDGVFVRLYPREIRLGQSPDEQPLLVRRDGAGAFVTNGNVSILLRDPFNLGPAPAPRPADAYLLADAAVAWMQAGAAQPQVHMIGSLKWPMSPDVAGPAQATPNFLSMNFWKSVAPAPILGAPGAGAYALGAALADPVAFVTSVVRQLSTDQNPRQAPRLPTMARTESLLAVQLAGAPADPYCAVLTGGWLTRETDSASYRAANAGGAGEHEVHAPGVGATMQLGFDLWVAAAHRARPIVPTADVAAALNGVPNNWILLQANAASAPPAPPAAPSTLAGAVLQTVPAFVETPELALTPDDDTPAVENWITTRLGDFLGTPNDPELHRQMSREVRAAKYGRRDMQWALRRAIRHARDLLYIETPLFGATAHADGAPADPVAACDMVWELANRLSIEPRLRVVILTPRVIPFAKAFDPWSAFFYTQRNAAIGTLTLAGGKVDGRPRVVAAHPMGMPGRPLVIRTTTVIVDDVWCATGSSSLTRRGLSFDGALDVVLTDRQLDRGVGTAIRAHRKALMAMHLGVAPPASPQAAPAADWVRLHQGGSAHAAFADLLAHGGGGKLAPLWAGPDLAAPGAVQPHPAELADPDGLGGASFIATVAAALAGDGAV